MKIGRNSLCSCNSGKKYKNCCLVKIETEKREANRKRNEAIRKVFSREGDIEQNKIVRDEMFQYMKDLFGTTKAGLTYFKQ